MGVPGVPDCQENSRKKTAIFFTVHQWFWMLNISTTELYTLKLESCMTPKIKFTQRGNILRRDLNYKNMMSQFKNLIFDNCGTCPTMSSVSDLVIIYTTSFKLRPSLDDSPRFSEVRDQSKWDRHRIQRICSLRVRYAFWSVQRQIYMWLFTTGRTHSCKSAIFLSISGTILWITWS